MRSLYNFFDNFTRMRCTATYGINTVKVVHTAAEEQKLLDCMPLRHVGRSLRKRKWERSPAGR